MDEFDRIYFDWKTNRWRDKKTGRFVKTPKGTVIVTISFDYRAKQYRKGRDIRIDAYIRDRLRRGETPHEARRRLERELLDKIRRAFGNALSRRLREVGYHWEYDPTQELPFDYDIKYKHPGDVDWRRVR